MIELQPSMPSRRTARDLSRGLLSAANVSTLGATQYVPGPYLVFGGEGDISVLGEFSATREAVVFLVKEGLDVFETASAAIEWPISSFDVVLPWPLTDAVFWWAGSDPQKASALQTRDSRLEPFYEKLEQIKSGAWDDSRGVRPNDTAITAARRALHELKGGSLAPARVYGADERIVLYFKVKDKYANLEFFNRGTAAIVMSNGQGAPKVALFSEDQLSTVLADIRAYLIR